MGNSVAIPESVNAPSTRSIKSVMIPLRSPGSAGNGPEIKLPRP